MFKKKAPTHPKSILIYVVPGFGDVLLASPLLRSIHLAYPQAKISVVLRDGTESVLEGAKEVFEVIKIPKRLSYFRTLKLILKHLRTFDVSFSTSPTDRATLFCFFASKYRLQVLEPKCPSNFWKYLATDAAIPIYKNQHIVSRNLALLDFLGTKKRCEFITPKAKILSDAALGFNSFLAQSYCVLQPVASAEYKRWPIEYWRELILFILKENLKVILSCGAGSSERAYCESIASSFDERVISSEGKLSFSDLSELLLKSEFFVGIDTAATHLAAALGVKTFAIFGPTNSKMWGPWPSGYQEQSSPYLGTSTFEAHGNVVLFASECSCIPIDKSCSYSETIHSQCLVATPVHLVSEQIVAYQQRSVREKIMG